MAAQTGILHRFSVKQGKVTVMTVDSSASTTGPTYASSGFWIPLCQSITLSGAAAQEQLEGDDIVGAVETTDEAVDFTVEHGRDSFDMKAAIKAWNAYASGNNYNLDDIPAETTRYVKMEFRCHKTGSEGGDLLITLYKCNVANLETGIENKAFGSNSFSGKAIYPESTMASNGTQKNIRVRYEQRETAIPLVLNNDTTPPTVSCVPADAATGVSVSANIVWTASEDLDPNHVTSDNVLVFTAAGVAVAGVVTLANDGASTAVTFNPTGDLSGSTAYIAMLTTNIRDLAGNKLAAPSLINFTTA